MKLLSAVFKHSSQLSLKRITSSIGAVVFSVVLGISALHFMGSIHAPLVSADSLRPQLGTKVVVNKTADTANQVTASRIGAGTGPTQVCVPAANNMPTPLSLTGLPATLKVRIDQPDTYQLYGKDGQAVRTEIRKCGPIAAGQNVAEFTAVTRYQLTWQYQYTNDGGVCEITRASVGIHINQTMPAWHPTLATQPEFAQKWQTFNEALITHENGHTETDIAYAQRLLDDLNQFPRTACDLLAQSVKQLTDSTVSELEQANDNYDSSTDHGATQGAILP